MSVTTNTVTTDNGDGTTTAVTTLTLPNGMEIVTTVKVDDTTGAVIYFHAGGDGP